MSQPTPPGDMPLFDGLGTEWNDVVGALPEDRRGELAPRIKERLDTYEPLKQYQDFHRSGISPDQISRALSLSQIIEQDPQSVYDTIGKHLGLTKAETQQVVEAIEDNDGEDPRIATLEAQVKTLAEIALAQRSQTVEQQQAAEQDAILDKELKALRDKYGDDVNEREIVMRMLHEGLSAEDAYQDYAKFVSDVRSRRPSPMLIGGAGTAVPRNAIDPTKLDSAGTKDLVAQMMQRAVEEKKQ